MAELTLKQVKALYDEFDIFCYRPTFDAKESNKNYVFNSVAAVIWYAQGFEDPTVVYKDFLHQVDYQSLRFLSQHLLGINAYRLLRKLADGSLEIFFEDDNLDCFTVYGDSEDD